MPESSHWGEPTHYINEFVTITNFCACRDASHFLQRFFVCFAMDWVNPAPHPHTPTHHPSFSNRQNIAAWLGFLVVVFNGPPLKRSFVMIPTIGPALKRSLVMTPTIGPALKRSFVMTPTMDPLLKHSFVMTPTMAPPQLKRSFVMTPTMASPWKCSFVMTWPHPHTFYIPTHPISMGYSSIVNNNNFFADEPRTAHVFLALKIICGFITRIGR